MNAQGKYFPYEYQAENHPEDPDTGLPTIPVGYYWRISRTTGYVHIKLMRKRKGWFSEEVRDSLVSKYEYTKDKLYNRALQLLHYWEEEERERAENPSPVLPKSGNYPPRKLI